MLKQQVEVTLRLSVNAEESKEDIKKFIEGLINTHAMHSTPHNRMTYNELEVVDIREEAEIYSTNKIWDGEFFDSIENFLKQKL